MKETIMLPLKKICSCLILSLLVLGLFSTGKSVQASGTTSDLLSQIEPYHTYRYSTGNASLGGVTYTDCLLFNTYNNITGSAAFDLEGKYKSLTFCTAHVSGGQTRTVSVYCDDELVWSESVLADDLPSSHTSAIDLTGVEKLKFVVSGSPASFTTAIANMNLISNGYTQAERKAPVTSNFLTNVQAYNSNRYSTGTIKIGDKTYEGALKFNTYNSVAGHATYNLMGNYKSMSFYVGNETNSAGNQTRTITITGDGVELYSAAVCVDTAPHYASISVEGVEQLKITVSGTASSYNAVLAGVNLTSNGIVQKILLDQETLKLTYNNQTSYLKPTIIPTDASNQNISWTSSNSEIATVNNQGLVTAIDNGTAVITATTISGEKNAICTVTVSGMPIPISKTAISIASDNVYTGSAITPKITVTYDGKTLKSGTDYVVTYSNNINAGTATVTFNGIGKYNGSVSKNFIIAKAAPTLTASSSISTLFVGETSQITANAIGSISYASSNTGIATVSSTGIITAIAPGTVNIKVTAGDGGNYDIESQTFTISISKYNQEMTADTSKTTLVVGKSSQITVSGYGTITYASSNPKIATVSSTGKIKAVSPGTVTITVKADGGNNYNADSESLKITVNPKSTKILSVKNTGRKQATVKWQKVAGVSGYEIRYIAGSTKKVATVKKAAIASKKIKKLTVGRTYKVSIRTYKKVGNKKYYSTWSKVKKVKIKK